MALMQKFFRLRRRLASGWKRGSFASLKSIVMIAPSIARMTMHGWWAAPLRLPPPKRVGREDFRG